MVTYCGISRHEMGVSWLVHSGIPKPPPKKCIYTTKPKQVWGYVIDRTDPDAAEATLNNAQRLSNSTSFGVARWTFQVDVLVGVAKKTMPIHEAWSLLRRTHQILVSIIVFGHAS